jgi:secretion/DNA translocation related TadE-like protein
MKRTLRDQGQIKNEHGSGTIMSVGLITVLVLSVAALFRVIETRTAELSATLAAESAAIGAADALHGFRTGHPCEVAGQIATQNMANVVECRIVGFDAFVRVRTKSLGMVHFASARAGLP